MSNRELALITGAVALVLLSILTVAAYPDWQRSHERQCITHAC